MKQKIGTCNVLDNTGEKYKEKKEERDGTYHLDILHEKTSAKHFHDNGDTGNTGLLQALLMISSSHFYSLFV